MLFADKDRVHALRIVGPNGETFTLPAIEKETAPEMEGVGVNAPLTRPTGVASDNSIRASSEKSNNEIQNQKIEAEAERKSKVQAQERDFAPTERELLLEAATKRKAAPELKEHAKKARKLEELQGKLEKQQAQLSKAAWSDEAEKACEAPGFGLYYYFVEL